jgi:putative NADH-flavin reductase
MGYFVTAIVRNPDTLTLRHKNLVVHKGDVLDLPSFSGALEGHEAVISSLGIPSNKPTTIFSDGIQNIITGMKANGVHRLMVVSALAVEINANMPWWMKVFIKNILEPLLRDVYADTLKMEQIIRKTDLAWTIVRPPRLTNKKVTGHYREAIDDHLTHARIIARADLAHYMLHHVDTENTFRRTIEVAY